MKKKIVLTMVAMVTAASLMGCGITTTTTTTYTETTTDADGNTTTTTTTTTNGETTTETTETTEATEDAPEEETVEVERTVASIAFANETDFDFAELYFASAASDNWGEDVLGDDAPLAVGEVITFDEFTYSADNTVWDMKVVDAEGNNVEFSGADMLASSDPTNIYITFEYDAETQSYSASLQ